MATKKTATKKRTGEPAKSTTKPAKAPARTAKAPAKTAKSAPGGLTAAQQIERKIAELDDWRGERLAEIRALIREVDPDVVEDWKWMGTPVWSHEGMYVLANPHKDKVKITFHHGAQLEDPKKLFNNGLDGNKWRAIDLFEGDVLDRAGFKALLREAIQYNLTHAAPKSKGSRKALMGA